MTIIEALGIFISGICLGAFTAWQYTQNKMDEAFGTQKRFIDAQDRYIEMLSIELEKMKTITKQGLL